MSWQVPLCIGILYFCLGLAILNTEVFNSGLGPEALVTVTTSTLIFQPIPTGLASGYLPYKSSALPWLGNMGAARGESFGRKERHKQQGADSNDRTYTDGLPGCQTGKKSCYSLGHPEICCNENHTCLPTNNTLSRVYCCNSPDPITIPCDDKNLQCELNWYQCPASANGGCCEYGQHCGLLECYDGELTTPAIALATITTGLGIDSGGVATGKSTTISYRLGANRTTSKSTPSRATATTSLIIDSQTAMGKSTEISRAISSSTSNTNTDPSRPEASNANFAVRSRAAGSRAKVGRYWSWAVMVWWIIAAIVEGI